MMMLSGVFFPADQLPAVVQLAAQLLPLSHGVALARPLLLGEIPQSILLHLGVLLAYAVGGFYLAVVLTRRRLLT
jgi:lipooligosaccharide transport system permease protein